MAPRTIMFLRHAEKPADHGAPHGVDQHGQPDDHCLSVRGWTRAGALAALMDHLPSADRPGMVRPARVMATRPTDGYRSKREHDTARPTAERLGLDIDDAYAHDDTAAAAASLLADDRDTLIVWHHGSIPEFIGHLPLAAGVSVPTAWPDDRFDLVWCLTADGHGAYTFSTANQDLIAGDQPASAT